MGVLGECGVALSSYRRACGATRRVIAVEHLLEPGACQESAAPTEFAALVTTAAFGAAFDKCCSTNVCTGLLFMICSIEDQNPSPGNYRVGADKVRTRDPHIRQRRFLVTAHGIAVRAPREKMCAIRRRSR